MNEKELNKLLMQFDNDFDKLLVFLRALFKKQNNKIIASLITKINQWQKDGIYNPTEITADILDKYGKDLLKDIAESKYNYSAIANITLMYDKIDTNLDNIYKLQGLDISGVGISKVKKEAVKDLLKDMQGQGMYKGFIKPMTKVLYSRIKEGASISELQSEVKNTLNPKDSKYIHYSNQVVHDSIMQYDGKVNNQVMNEFKFTKIKYVGSLIKTSRGQCCKWVNMKYINVKDLPAEIRWANNTKNYYGRFRCGGMIEGTTKANFIELRGGYNCRHRAFGIK